jgi:acetyl esterase/lipase
MSIRAELIRVALRCFFKDREDHKPDVATIRKNLDRTKYFFPSPPKGTTVARLTIGNVPAVRVTRPGSRAGCHVLYLHGGGYCYGSILLYRDFVWRIAEAAEASVLCIDYRLAPEHPFPAAIEDATERLPLAPVRRRGPEAPRHHGGFRGRRTDVRQPAQAAR